MVCGAVPIKVKFVHKVNYHSAWQACAWTLSHSDSLAVTFHTRTYALHGAAVLSRGSMTAQLMTINCKQLGSTRSKRAQKNTSGKVESDLKMWKDWFVGEVPLNVNFVHKDTHRCSGSECHRWCHWAVSVATGLLQITPDLLSKKTQKNSDKKRLNISAKTDLPCSALFLRQLSYLLA